LKRTDTSKLRSEALSTSAFAILRITTRHLTSGYQSKVQ